MLVDHNPACSHVIALGTLEFLLFWRHDLEWFGHLDLNTGPITEAYLLLSFWCVLVLHMRLDVSLSCGPVVAEFTGERLLLEVDLVDVHLQHLVGDERLEAGAAKMVLGSVHVLNVLGEMVGRKSHVVTLWTLKLARKCLISYQGIRWARLTFTSLILS